MYLHYHNKQITGILSVVPANEIYFDDEMSHYSFSPAQCMQLKKIMGYNKHRICKTKACISDLIIYGFQHLFREYSLAPQKIDAFVLLTNSPDYPVPPTSNIIQGKLGLKKDMVCLDINQGCAGYMIGLMQAFMLLDQPEINMVAIATADIESRTHSFKDRSSFPLMGDSATITLVENRPSANIHQYIKMDGSGAMSICMPAGGMKEPANEDSIRMVDDGSGNVMSRHHIRMKGDEIYSFVMQQVPSMFSELFSHYGKTFDDVEFFMVHQPNKFILNRLAKKAGIDKKKMPTNIVETLGNSASSTIPNAITLNLKERIEYETIPMCLAAFGEGLIWSATILDVGPLSFCRLIEMDI